MKTLLSKDYDSDCEERFESAILYRHGVTRALSTLVK